MPHYISLVKFTDQGVKNVKDYSMQLEAADQRAKAAGIKVTRYFTLGSEYDIVVVVDAPNDEVVAKTGLGIMSQGFVRGKATRAFTLDEFLKLI
jgi:uncharacterized protein with GYD domain